MTVCATESMLSTLISAPGPTEDGVVKPKSLIVITGADDVAVAAPAVGADELDAAPVDDPVEPQAVNAPRATAHSNAADTRILILKGIPPVGLCGCGGDPERTG